MIYTFGDSPLQSHAGFDIPYRWQNRHSGGNAAFGGGIGSKQYKMAEFIPQSMTWWTCRYNLSFACEGTVTHPNTRYG